MRGWMVIVLVLAACKSDSKESTKGAPAAAPAPAPTPTETAAAGCKSVAVCDVMPLAQVNSTLGATLGVAQPRNGTDGSRLADSCTYKTSDSRQIVQIERICIPDAAEAKMIYDAKVGEQPQPGQTRKDVAIGDKAVYIVDPSAHRIDMTVVRGNVLIAVTDDGVEAGKDGPAVAGMTELAKTLLAK